MKTICATAIAWLVSASSAVVRWLRILLLIVLGSCVHVPSARGVSPQEALKQMKVADGFEVSLVASEPEIRQPLSVTFDERGRM